MRTCVGRAAPFHCALDPGPKPVPFTVSVNPVEPAVVAAGFKLVIDRIDPVVPDVPVTAK